MSASDDKPDTSYRQVISPRLRVRRRTPSAPMAALNPETNGEPETTMGPRTRDEVLLKTIARVERIDTEVGAIVDDLSATVSEVRLTRKYQKDLSASVRNLERKLETIKDLLVDVLTRLPQSQPAPDSGPQGYPDR